MTTQLVACPRCDLLQRLPRLAGGAIAFCRRCGHRLAKQSVDSADRCLALTAAALIVLVVANVTPLMELSVAGNTATTTIIGGTIEMWHHGQQAAAVIVAFCAVIAPAGFLLSMLTILLAAKRAPAPHWVGEILRWSRYLHVWSLHEVMLLGILVALVKIAELARVIPEIGVFSVGALTLLFPAIMTQFDAREIWDRIEWAGGATAQDSSRDVDSQDSDA